MPRKAKPSITDWGHAQQPNFGIPLPGAEHHDAAAQHYGEAARHQRQAAKLSLSGHPGKASHRAHRSAAPNLHGERHAEEAAKSDLENQ